MSGIVSGGTSVIPSSNGLIVNGETIGDTVTDSTVNVVSDLVYEDGGNLEALAQNTANNAINQLQIANNLSSAGDSLTAAWDSFDLDVLIPSQIWSLLYWEKYLASYGVALGDFNIGMARAMQKDIGNTSTDCFI